MKGGELVNDDFGLEREADLMGARAGAKKPILVPQSGHWPKDVIYGSPRTTAQRLVIQAMSGDGGNPAAPAVEEKAECECKADARGLQVRSVVAEDRPQQKDQVVEVVHEGNSSEAAEDSTKVVPAEREASEQASSLQRVATDNSSAWVAHAKPVRVAQLVRYPKRTALSRSDMSHRAQHTAAVVRIPQKGRFRFQSNKKGHAEDHAINFVRYLAEEDELGHKGKKVITLYITKSPCTNARRGHVCTTSKKKGCTEELMALDGKIINGYTIKLKLKVWRIYTPSGNASRAASIAALIALRKRKIEIEPMDSDDSAVEDMSDGEDAQNIRHKHVAHIESANKG